MLRLLLKQNIYKLYKKPITEHKRKLFSDMGGTLLLYVERGMLFTGISPLGMVNFNETKYKLYGNIVLISYLVLLSLLYVDIPFIWHNPSKLTEAINFLTPYTIVALKIMVCRSTKFADLICDMVLLEQNVKANGNKKILETHELLVKRSKFFQVYCIFFTISGTLQLFVLNFIKYFVLWNKQGHNDEGDRRLPFYMWLPFNHSDNGYYLLGYAVCVYFVILCVTFYFLAQGLFIILPLYISFRLKMLCHVLRNMKHARISDNVEETSSNNYTEIFGVCIYEHLRIIRTTKTYNDCIKYLMLLDFLVLSCEIALVLFEFISSESMQAKQFSVIHLLVLLAQMLIMYWFANEIREDSAEIARVLYEIEWYKHNRRLQSSIQIMMIRAQKPLALTIGPFGEMSLEMAVMILKAAYTYVTVLRNIYGRA